MSVTAQLPGALRQLEVHQRAWQGKPLLRELYGEFFDRIDQWRSQVPGRDVELGSGLATYGHHRPGTLCCDLLPFPWLDFAADACRLPLAEASVANVTLIDVLHHLAYVRRFFDEIARVLAPGGRLIMIEPYLSLQSWPIYRFLHREPLNYRARPLAAEPDEPICDPGLALDANQAIPTVTFWRDRRLFERRYPDLSILHRERLSLLLYPLSGGFESRRLVPAWAVGLVRRLERALQPLARFLAFRCLVVVGKAATGDRSSEPAASTAGDRDACAGALPRSARRQEALIGASAR